MATNRKGSPPGPPSEDVRRVITSIVDASCNSFARMLIERCRQMMADELPAVRVLSVWQPGQPTSPASYIAGRNDVLRELVKLLEDRLERQGLTEQVASDVRVVVEANGSEDECYACGPDCCCKGKHHG